MIITRNCSDCPDLECVLTPNPNPCLLLFTPKKFSTDSVSPRFGITLTIDIAFDN